MTPHGYAGLTLLVVVAILVIACLIASQVNAF
jgi:hypothetical protein